PKKMSTTPRSGRRKGTREASRKSARSINSLPSAPPAGTSHSTTVIPQYSSIDQLPPLRLPSIAPPGPAPSGLGPQGAHALALRHRGGAIEVLWQLPESSRQYSPSPSDFESPSMRGAALGG